MHTNAVIYARSSPDCPVSTEDQIETLKAIAADRGWTVSLTFVDRPLLVRKGRERRPGEDGLVSAIRAGGIQKVLIFSIDRIGRSLAELVAFIETCRAAGVGLYLHDREIDTTTSNGMSLFDLTGMMAFHLRQARRDKILRGQAVARSASVRFGRPPIPTIKVEKAKQLLVSGKGIRQTARLAGISPASVSRLKSDIELLSSAR
jgi:DNA invertase Pin-like site-specific DNA recombinase